MTPGTSMIELDRVSKRFGGVDAVTEASLSVTRGELLAVLGPSGCGKTTMLRMIAGFELPDSGSVSVDGRVVSGGAWVPPERRQVGMVFQDYALFPHLSVADNVGYGLPKKARAARVGEVLELVGLGGLEARRPNELSGGQQQRVALARALAPEPPLLLLDEPLSNLDAALRERTRDELRALLKSLGMTAIFVTHDQEEAFALSDRIAVMERGRLQQVGSPEELYGSPANAFVASFLGRANFLDATVDSGDGDRAVCRLAGGAAWTAALSADAPRAPGAPLRVMVRPEGLELAGTDAAGALPGRVLDRRYAGSATFYRVALDGGPEVLIHGRPHEASAGDAVRVALHPRAEPVAYPVEAR